MGCFVGLLTLGVGVPDPKVPYNSRGVDVVLYAKFQPQGSNGLVGLYRHYTHAHSHTQTQTRIRSPLLYRWGPWFESRSLFAFVSQHVKEAF